MIEYSRAKAYQEVFDMMEMAEGMIKGILKQINEPVKNYEI